jgi:hypothetical protein
MLTPKSGWPTQNYCLDAGTGEFAHLEHTEAEQGSMSAHSSLLGPSNHVGMKQDVQHYPGLVCTIYRGVSCQGSWEYAIQVVSTPSDSHHLCSYASKKKNQILVGGKFGGEIGLLDVIKRLGDPLDEGIYSWTINGEGSPEL